MQTRNRELATPPARRRRLERSAVIGTHHALHRHAGERRCDVCDAKIPAGDDEGGSGLYVWVRAGEVRYEEPPLCRRCGPTLALIAERAFTEEEEEEG
jgi:hypothetical protein